MKKILVVLSSLHIGGAEARMTDIAEALPKDEYEIDFLCMDEAENQFYEERLNHCGVRIIKIPALTGKNIIFHYIRLKEVIAEGNYDIVHANTSYHSGFVVAAAKKCGVPVRIVHSRTTGYGYKRLVNRIAAVVGKKLIRKHANVRLAISDASAKFLFGTDENVLILPNAFNLAEYKSDTSAQETALKKEYSLENAYIIGNVGRFVPSKNQKLTIDIFKEYLKEKTEAKLVFIGDGESFEDVKAYSQTSGVDDRIIFLGRRDDVPVWMKVFDVVLFTSEYEGLGNVAIESQAAGTPCVCSTAVPQEVDMGIGIISFVSNANPVETWCEKIREFGRTEPPCFEKINDCFEKRGYTVEHEVETLMKIYEKCD